MNLWNITLQRILTHCHELIALFRSQNL